MEPMQKTEWVKRALRRRRSAGISSLECFYLSEDDGVTGPITRLSGIIHRLKGQGWKIESRPDKTETASFVNYVLVSDPNSIF